MRCFWAMMKLNMRHRLRDGFAVGYNIFFPILMIGILGVLSMHFPHGSISSYAYYTVVTIPFCIVMAIITAAYACKDDAYADTAERVLLSPVSVSVIVAVKVLSCTLTIFVCSILTYTGAAIITGIGVQGIWKIALLFLSLCYATAAAGTWIGLGMKNFMTIKNVMNVPISVFAICGGVFFPLGTFHKVGEIILCSSPFTWINRSIFLLLYDKQQDLLMCVSVICVCLGMICSIGAIKTFQKGEYCNGSLPGYEK